MAVVTRRRGIRVLVLAASVAPLVLAGGAALLTVLLGGTCSGGGGVGDAPSAAATHSKRACPMSNHNPTRDRRTHTSRGHARQDANLHASPAGTGHRRLLRVERHAPSPVCDKSVTDCDESVRAVRVARLAVWRLVRGRHGV